MCFFYHAFVVAVVAAVSHAPVVLCPVYSCLRFPVLVPVVRLLGFWTVYAYLPMVRAAVVVRVLGFSERVRVAGFEFVDCPVVTVVPISVVCLCGVLR